MKIFGILLSLFVVSAFVGGCETKTADERAAEFIESHLAIVKPLAIEAALANWKAANSGKGEDYDKFAELQLKIRQIYSNPKEYALMKKLRDSGKIEDHLLTRQINDLYYGYLSNQIEPDLLKEIVELSTKIEKDFSIFRASIGEKKVTDNEIKEILKTETDSAKRKETWLASKQVGGIVEKDLIHLVKLRNQTARKVGFNNYHTLSLTASELDVKELDKIFDELDKLTKEPFAQLKAELDGRLAEMYGVSADQVGPWHYHDPFFQETPLVFGVDLDGYYEDTDVLKLTVDFYDSIGFDVESIIAKSDLYEREGKNPHAFCTDINREGDVRVLANIENNEQWMNTMLHELGHGVYDKFNDPNVPFLLRSPAHIFTTEAIAMLFGRLSRNAFWIQEMLELTDQQRTEIEKVTRKYSQMQQLIFARWVLVMYNFEKQLYANPDQDLNTLWWEMVEKYQLIKKPDGREEPDWASKIHFTIAPCYYHNYMLGELLASQLHHNIVTNVLGPGTGATISYVGQPKIGEFLQKKVFEPGATYNWNEMIERATGEKLTPKYFAAQFVE